MSGHEYTWSAQDDTIVGGSNQTYLTAPALASIGTANITTSTYPGSLIWNTSGTYTTTSTSPWALGANDPPRTQINHDDIIVDGRSLRDFMDSVAKRLTILQPDPEKLEKYQALREAYEHYQTLEALLTEEKNSEP